MSSSISNTAAAIIYFNLYSLIKAGVADCSFIKMCLELGANYLELEFDFIHPGE